MTRDAAAGTAFYKQSILSAARRRFFEACGAFSKPRTSGGPTVKRPRSLHLDVLRRMAAVGQPLVCRPPRDRWCVADSAVDARTPRVHSAEEFYVSFQTALALEHAGLVEKVDYCLALSARGRQALSAVEEAKQSHERRREDRWKRAAMMWLLRSNGHTFREIGELMGSVGAARVAEIIGWYERHLKHRAYGTSGQKGFEQRLIAAGALPPPSQFSWDSPFTRTRFLDMNLPPNDAAPSLGDQDARSKEPSR